MKALTGQRSFILSACKRNTCLTEHDVCDYLFHSTCEEITIRYFETRSSIDEAAKIGLDKIKSSVERKDLLSDDRYCSCKYAELSSLPVEIAADILHRYHADTGIRLRTTENGHFLFNAISIVLCGNESKSNELLYKTTLMMVLEDIHLLSPDYSDAALNCAQIGSFPMVTKRPLLSVYPDVNGTKDLAFRALHITIYHAEVNEKLTKRRTILH
ncbi:hypothetical protein ACJMK2_006977 [Sinanodonta woodiana]|uniref:Uncharacterized protein n=1 Tax=Sinanodonta woodiana TaxID=1069815 RepID=A0ABD3VI83_SINWO